MARWHNPAHSYSSSCCFPKRRWLFSEEISIVESRQASDPIRCGKILFFMSETSARSSLLASMHYWKDSFSSSYLQGTALSTSGLKRAQSKRDGYPETARPTRQSPPFTMKTLFSSHFFCIIFIFLYIYFLFQFSSYILIIGFCCFFFHLFLHFVCVLYRKLYRGFFHVFFFIFASMLGTLTGFIFHHHPKRKSEKRFSFLIKPSFSSALAFFPAGVFALFSNHQYYYSDLIVINCKEVN